MGERKILRRFEPDGALRFGFEEIFLLLRHGAFLVPSAARFRRHEDDDLRRRDPGPERGDPLGVGPVEGVGDAEEAAEDRDGPTVVGGKSGVGGVIGPGDALPVIAGDLGDEGDLPGREGLPFPLADEAGRFLVVAPPVGGLGPADVVEEGGGAETEAATLAPPVPRARARKRASARAATWVTCSGSSS